MLRDFVAALRPQKALAALLAASTMVAFWAAPAFAGSNENVKTTTPIKHLVVIFQENVSFDHYFATYPVAANAAGEPAFKRRLDSPAVNGLNTNGLINHNPNSHAPFRLSRAQNYTCDQDHDYLPEQQAFDAGLMDKFPQFVGVGTDGSCPDYGYGANLVMGYYDGNTVTALWHYAQDFALNDNSFGTTFGPSTPGAINLASGNTSPYDPAHTIGDLTGSVDGTSVIGDPDPYYDDCGSPTQVAVLGTNIGDLLNAKGITWGWFQGGFKPTQAWDGINPAVCGSQSTNLGGATVTDYSAHHEPFEYYASTANPHHLPATSSSMIGYTDQANHQYDLADFWTAAYAGNLPAVSFLKAKKAQDGHSGYSSPLDEQAFIVNTINQLETLPDWNSTAVVISYDDSDGWYDHQMGPIVKQSVSAYDGLNAPGMCGGTNTDGITGRCGYGPRLPLLVVSPYARQNYVDSSLTDQSSILKFVEDNWQTGRIGSSSYDDIAGTLNHMFNFNQRRSDKLFLDPVSGEIVSH
jgi:phospholipase C